MSIERSRAPEFQWHQMADTTLVGRQGEQSQLDQTIRGVRDAHSAVLVVRARRGVGKTALLDDAVSRAPGFRVIRARAAASERAFPYAGLQLLCGPLRDHLEQLPSALRDSLTAAVDAHTFAGADPFLVGLATLRLLSDAAVRQPLLCTIDDAHWLDEQSAQALAFVARRLDSEPILLLLAMRDAPRLDALDGLPELRLEHLSPADSRALLSRLVPGPMDAPVVDRIVAEADGNPRAILEFGSGTSPAELGGGFGLPSLGERIDAEHYEFLDRMALLPESGQRLLLAAAAEPIGDPAVLWRAAAQLAISSEHAHLLEAAGMVRWGSRVLFPRPWLRQLVYVLATEDERRRVHRALAAATDPAADPVRRAWHQARATATPDEALAEELERCAPEAGRRGGVSAAAVFLAGAAALTLDPRLRAERALAAAAVEHVAGADAAAALHLQTAGSGPLDRAGLRRLEVQRAQVAVASGQVQDAAELLLECARGVDAADPGLARETYLQALGAAVTAGRLGLVATEGDVAKAAAAGPPAPEPGTPLDRLLDGLVTRCTNGLTSAAEPLHRALEEFGHIDPAGEPAGWRWLACVAAAELWDDEAWDTQTTLALALTRESGALAHLPTVLNARAVAELAFGGPAAACRYLAEAACLRQATAVHAVVDGAILRAAWLGQEERGRQLFRRARQEALDRNEGRTLTTVSLATAVLCTSLGRCEEAFAAAQEAAEADELGLIGPALTELVETGVRVGERHAAIGALDRLSERTRASSTDWALGLEARSRALLAGEREAEALFHEAIQRLSRTRVASDLARTRLLYGEWLRRRGRRVDARPPLKAAWDAFAAMGAVAFAERAHRELLATGEKVRSRSVGDHAQLTAQEARIAYLAREGLSNPAIGARIFVSPRTVEYHLHKVFAKLGISSRGELHLVLPAAPPSVTPAPEPGEHLQPRGAVRL